MSLKWTGGQSESGILRKSEFKEKKEDLFVFGYSCKLFRDDDKALHIDQGKHLIPWMGDETLKIDRYDARGALHDLTRLEAPPGGYDWRVELTRAELDVEQLCDEERYRALHTDEDEEEMYKEEELKRLHAAGYGQVGFNYDAPAEPEPPPQPAEVDEEPFIPTPAFRALLPIDTVFPETLKQNAIIEKTAKFIASQGAQMEILIKAKQGDNPQFNFLNRDSNKPPENEEYLHPSLASTVIESAPAIPSIHYKPSADCDYTMLISKMRGEDEMDVDGEPRGDVPPPGTEPPRHRTPGAEIYRAPVMYTKGPDGNHVDPTAPMPSQYQQYAAYYQQYQAQEQQKQVKKPPPPPSLKSTAPVSFSIKKLKEPDPILPKPALPYESSSDDDSEKPAEKQPAQEEFKEPPKVYPPTVPANNIPPVVMYKIDPQYNELPLMRPYVEPAKPLKPPPNPPMLEYNEVPKQEEIVAMPEAPPPPTFEEVKEIPTVPMKEVPTVEKVEIVIEKEKEVPHVDVSQKKEIPLVKDSSQNRDSPYTRESPFRKESPPKRDSPYARESPYRRESSIKRESPYKRGSPLARDSPYSRDSPHKREGSHKRDSPHVRDRDRDSSHKREKKKHKDRRKEHRSKSESRESRRNERRSAERERKREKDRVKESEMEGETEAERAKQLERRRRAAEFLKKVGVDPAAAALPTSSLASAMVDTLESIRKKKAEEEEKRRRRDKRRHRDRRG
ncbi:hypothetical protein HF086_009923 [Spodoptera exigua]|uniref:SURP motif domain-containing protein n=1 Tax=Spodoptera exigua TaxID=7107 RepID=A0A922M4X7_SPOEX|nr:hypothetical protein HF086_009923 [Spodoptera exigua]